MSRALISAILCVLAISQSGKSAELLKGDVLRVRLSQTICSATSKAGDPVRATVVGYINREDGGLTGLSLSGRITESNAVGLGIRRTRASLAIDFSSLQFTDGAVPFSGRLSSVDGARETVDATGTIRGIDAGNAPRNRITSRLIRMPTLNPYPDLALLAFKLVAPFFPEPEIHYPPGTELLIEVTAPVAVSGGDRVESAGGIPTWAQRVLRKGIEPRTVSGKGGNPADVINAVLLGTAKDITAAFESAGWTHADPNGPRAALRSILSVIEDRSDPRAPMSSQTYLGAKPAMMWQRVLNDAGKRHHVRVWRHGTYDDLPAWAVSATEDIAIGFDWRTFKVFHRIHPNIDIERRKLLTDLTATGCVESSLIAGRPQVPARMMNSTGDEMMTDGGIAFVAIGPCNLETLAHDPAWHQKHGTVLSRKARKLILSLRNDIVRANLIVGTYDAGKMIWSHFRNSRGDRLPEPVSASSDGLP